MAPVQSCSQLAPSVPSKSAGPGAAPSRRSAESSFQQQLQYLTANRKFFEREHGGPHEGRVYCVQAAQDSLTGRPILAPRPGEPRPSWLCAEPGRQPREAEGRARAKEFTEDPTNHELSADGAVWAEPLMRVLSALGPNTVGVLQSRAASEATLDRIALRLVRKVGLGAASVYLEFGHGVLAEGKLVVQVTDQGLEITLRAPYGVDSAELSSALCKRLENRGIRVSRIDVT